MCDGGKLSEHGREGTPDLVVEIVSKFTSGMDYVPKLGLYHNAGVREHWIVALCGGVYADMALVRRRMGEYSFTDGVASSVMKGFEVSLAQAIGGS